MSDTTQPVEIQYFCTKCSMSHGPEDACIWHRCANGHVAGPTWLFILPKANAAEPDKTFTPCIACIADWIEKMGFGMKKDGT